jgi:hypothetical protein
MIRGTTIVGFVRGRAYVVLGWLAPNNGREGWGQPYPRIWANACSSSAIGILRRTAVCVADRRAERRDRVCWWSAR